MFSLSFVLLICATSVHFNLLQRPGRACAEASLLEDLVLPDPKPASITDLPGCVIIANDIARQQFESLSAPKVRIATLLQDTVIDADACIARMIQTARDKREICSDLVDGPEANFLSVQPIGPKFLLWWVQEKDQPPKVCDKIFESVLSVLFVDPSGHRLISANAAAAKILPPNVQFLTDIFETNQPEFDRVVTILTRFGPQQMILMNLDGGEKHRLIGITSCAVEALDCRATDRRFDALPLPLLKLAPNGDLLIANEAARRLLLIDGVESVNLNDLMDGLGGSVNDWLHRSAFGLGKPQSEFLRLTRARSKTFVQVTWSRILEQGVPQLFAILTDPTALKVLEAQFVQS